MAKILLIDRKKVTTLKKAKFSLEVKLQDYLEEYPQLIPIEEISGNQQSLICIGKEVNIPDSGSADLMFLDTEGIITIVETKLARNPRIRREVLGQVIEYASIISGWDVSDIYAQAHDYFLKSEQVSPTLKGHSAGEIFASTMGEDFSDENFRNSIEQNLQNGKLRLLIASDEINVPLKSMVAFLNSFSNFSVLLLQVSIFEGSEKGQFILSTSLIGDTSRQPLVSRRSRQQWDQDKFLQTLGGKNKDLVKIAVELLDFAKENAFELSWGTGAKVGSLAFQKYINGNPGSIYVIWSDGGMQIALGSLKNKGVDDKLLEDFRKELNERIGTNIPKDAIDQSKWPSINLKVFLNHEMIEAFKDIVKKFIIRI